MTLCNDHQSSCGDCGTCPEVTPGNWCELSCPDSLSYAQTVKIENPDSALVVCEIEVYGKGKIIQDLARSSKLNNLFLVGSSSSETQLL